MEKSNPEFPVLGHDHTPEPAASNQKSVLLRGLDPSFLLAAACTGIFYYIVLQPKMHGSLLHRYTTEHEVEYVIVALFAWGIVDIILKLFSFPKEMLALRQDWLPSRRGREPISNAAVLLSQVRARPRWLQESKVGKRLINALDYVLEKGSAKEYREHLQYLCEQDADDTHANYTLSRFVITVAPVLGFLGTVVHFGTALSGISFDEMTDRLATVVGEMGTAFNTTTAALAVAMSMMFLVFVCERIEKGIVHSIDRLVERELLSRFEIKDPSILPFVSAVQSASEETLQTIGTTLQRQIEVWTAALEALFQRFDGRQQLETQSWQTALDALRERNESYDAAREERLRQTLALVDSKQDRHMAQIQATFEKAFSLRDDFAGLVRTMESIARGEGKLVELQSVLSENLRVIRETQQIDEALHGLTAAIHLLTARHRQPGIHDAAA